MKKSIFVLLSILLFLAACTGPQAGADPQILPMLTVAVTATLALPTLTETPTILPTPMPSTATPLATRAIEPNVWTKIGVEVEDILALAVDPVMPTTLYAVTRKYGVFKSVDGGANWHAINQGLTTTEIQAVAINPWTPDILYLGTNGEGVFKSTNGGRDWVNAGLSGAIVRFLAIDPATADGLYA